MDDYTKALVNSDLYAVFATDGEGTTFRVSDPLNDRAAHRVWDRLDTFRRKGLLPQARFFEVRTVMLGEDRALVGPEVRSHDRYDKAPFSTALTTPVTNSRGFKNVEDAARAAWRALTGGIYTKNGYEWTQGVGGWFYYPNGQTAAQGLYELAKICQRRHLVLQGLNERWYVVDQEVL